MIQFSQGTGVGLFKNLDAEFFGGSARKDRCGDTFHFALGRQRLACDRIAGQSFVVNHIGVVFGANQPRLPIQVDDEVTRWVKVDKPFG